MIPPAVYSLWWGIAEQCSGLTRPMAEIRWYSVPGAEFKASTGMVVGLYRVGPDQIIMASQSVLQGQRVRHEMLHALIDRKSGSLHPREYFLDKCAGVVVCGSDCVSTSDPAPPIPAHIPSIAANLLKVRVAIDPADVSLTNFDGLGYAAVTVTAKNPMPFAVNVLPSPTAYPADLTFVLSAQGPAPGILTIERAAEPRAFFFRAGETKQFVFDLYAPRLGNWTAVGAFSNRWSTDIAAFRVIP